VLVEGLGVEIDEKDGLRYLQLRESVASAQGAYELGTAIYTGVAASLTATATATGADREGEGGSTKERMVEDPDAEAFAFFAAAAAAGHVGGAFMTADMLFSGEAAGADTGADADLQRAVELFAHAADKGHRSARMRMRALFKHPQ
jgi:TPR repeat protein